jgi:hypothetical protein
MPGEITKNVLLDLGVTDPNNPNFIPLSQKDFVGEVARYVGETTCTKLVQEGKTRSGVLALLSKRQFSRTTRTPSTRGRVAIIDQKRASSGE